jgi:hypothetical protein
MHAFLLEAVERETILAERRREFVAEAVDARDEMLRSGKGFAAADVHRYLRARIAGKHAARPKARSWRK